MIGADGNVVEALHTIAAKNAPDVIGLITTALSETQGADIPRTVRAFRERHPEHDAHRRRAGQRQRYAGLSGNRVRRGGGGHHRDAGPERRRHGAKPRQVNVLVSSMHSPADIEAIREWIEAFGLRPVVLPDIGDSLDGHMIEAGFPP